ncbi:cyclopropane-fatty-acyl-phospholipid synthase family protein [Burkholderia sp. FERM BP-3421]|uniref:SAM-dependent methyltransferase n=1 Tax=Burkholderia sp. FERM BP-3421 TaxID=1494466 RepID=UPI002362415A|nr:cyclopropane-fatty-acyl-phospholipid synthase family protein [Burkholderia sp. FERM BP-3421]WDD95770.1 cyclopropane-fatty-acyl-phospholipid synthase family protein [Burkholderia sp. FERM BP-3421]
MTVDTLIDPPATGASADAIQHHYDVGNPFYALWLDPGMTYSSALWLDGSEDLETAQRNKQDWHIDRSGIARGKRLLDVGCGWGGLMRRALARHPEIECVGLTLSQAQADYINALNESRIEVRLESWADHQPDQGYDGIVSVGAFEHFARLDQPLDEKIAGYRRFFTFCHDRLGPEGQVSLQTITYENAAREQFSAFFATEIFPESDLPHLAEICEAARGLFEIVELRNDRHHYARTLRHWQRRLREHKEEALALVGEAKYRDYDKYLALMVVAFHTGTMNLSRLALRRLPGSTPLSRGA